MHLRSSSPLRELSRTRSAISGAGPRIAGDDPRASSIPGLGLAGPNTRDRYNRKRSRLLQKADRSARRAAQFRHFNEICRRLPTAADPVGRRMGDFRHVRKKTVALRGRDFDDAMTADWARVPMISSQKFPRGSQARFNGVNRVVLRIFRQSRRARSSGNSLGLTFRKPLA